MIATANEPLAALRQQADAAACRAETMAAAAERLAAQTAERMAEATARLRAAADSIHATLDAAARQMTAQVAALRDAFESLGELVEQTVEALGEAAAPAATEGEDEVLAAAPSDEERVVLDEYAAAAELAVPGRIAVADLPPDGDAEPSAVAPCEARAPSQPQPQPQPRPAPVGDPRTAPPATPLVANGRHKKRR